MFPEANIELAYKGKLYRRIIGRELFERLIASVVERTLGPCRACLADAKLAPEQIDEVVMVGGSTRIPLVRTAVERLFKAKPHTELNPDEVVALGAAVQAGILAGDVEDKLLLDVTPLSLGIETMGGVVSKLIHRNSTIPASATESFTTAVDGQRNVLIHVLQGERELVKDCAQPGPFRSERHSADAGRFGPHRSSLSDRRERHPERHGARCSYRQRAERRGEALLRLNGRAG